jgi:hypothetical protein
MDYFVLVHALNLWSSKPSHSRNGISNEQCYIHTLSDYSIFSVKFGFEYWNYVKYWSMLSSDYKDR